MARLSDREKQGCSLDRWQFLDEARYFKRRRWEYPGQAGRQVFNRMPLALQVLPPLRRHHCRATPEERPGIGCSVCQIMEDGEGIVEQVINYGPETAEVGLCRHRP